MAVLSFPLKGTLNFMKNRTLSFIPATESRFVLQFKSILSPCQFLKNRGECFVDLCNKFLSLFCDADSITSEQFVPRLYFRFTLLFFQQNIFLTQHLLVTLQIGKMG